MTWWAVKMLLEVVTGALALAFAARGEGETGDCDGAGLLGRAWFSLSKSTVRAGGAALDFSGDALREARG
jgi:hypothetical protein